MKRYVMLLAAWGNKDREMCLRVLTRMYDQSATDPTLRMVALVLMHIEKLVRARALWESGKRGNNGTALGMSPYLYRELEPQVEARSLVQLSNAYTSLCTLDYEVKRGAFPRSSLELWIHQTTS